MEVEGLGSGKSSYVVEKLEILLSVFSLLDKSEIEIMTKIIRQHMSKEAIQAIMKGLKPYKKFNAKKYCGVIKLPHTPMGIQQSLRNEWD